MKALSLTLAALTLATSAAPPAAEAYYSRRDTVRCSDQAAGNAVAGALIGGVLGAILGGQSDNAGAGAALGAAAGGSLGLGLSCQEQTVYIENVDRYLDDDRFDSPYRWDGGSVMVTRSFMRPDGVMCNEYETTFATPRGPMRRVEVACRERGMWRHGYAADARDYRVIRDFRRDAGRGEYRRDYRDDRRDYRDERGGYRDDRGGYRDYRRDYRRGYQDDRGGYRDDRRGYQDDRGGYQDDRRDERDYSRDGRQENPGQPGPGRWNGRQAPADPRGSPVDPRGYPAADPRGGPAPRR